MIRRFAIDPEDLPSRVFFGDGAPLQPQDMIELRLAYVAAERRFPWAKGDLLLLDNMRTAHGRDAFIGPRRVWVAMSEPVEAQTETRKSEGGHAIVADV